METWPCHSTKVMQSDGIIDLSVTTCRFVCLTHSETKHSECQRLKQRKVYCRARQGEQVAHAHKTPNALEGEPPHLYFVFQQSIFKGQVSEWCPQVCDQLSWLVDGDQPLGARWRGSYVLLIIRYLISSQVLVEKKLPADARETRGVGSIPRSKRSPGERHGNPLQYSCLENPMDKGACWATVHGVAKSPTWLKQLSMHAWWWFFSIWKTQAWDTIIWVLHRGCGSGVCPEKASLGYISSEIPGPVHVPAPPTYQKFCSRYLPTQSISMNSFISIFFNCQLGWLNASNVSYELIIEHFY